MLMIHIIQFREMSLIYIPWIHPKFVTAVDQYPSLVYDFLKLLFGIIVRFAHDRQGHSLIAVQQLLYQAFLIFIRN